MRSSPSPPARVRRPVEIVRQADAPRRPTPVLVLDSLGRMHPATAVAIITATTGLVVGGIVAVVALVAAVAAAAAAVAGMVAIAAVSLAVTALALSGGPPSSRR
jgi:hypothetical protein